MNFKRLIILALLFLFSSCSEKKIHKEYNDTIKQVNDFLPFQQEVQKPEPPINNYIKRTCPKATIQAYKINTRSLGALLAKLYNVNINTPSNDEDFNLNINLQNVCLENVLDELTESYNVGYTKAPHGYNIYNPELRSKIFYIDYHNFQRNGSSAMSINANQLNDNSHHYSSNNKNFTTIETKSEEKFWDNIESNIAVIIRDNNLDVTKDSSKESVSVYRESGIVVVRAYPRALKNVEKFVTKINSNTLRQVIIEAKILEIELKNEFNSGIKWQALNGKLSFNQSVDSVTKNIPLINPYTGLPSQNELISAVARARVGNGTDFDGIIQMLSSQGKISVLSSPRIAAINNQRALIKFGQDSYYITNVTNSTIAVTNASGATIPSQQGNVNFEPFFSGIALDTTPRIMGKNEVLMHIHPIISRVTTENKDYTVNGAASNLPLATIQSRETDTVVKATSGDIIVIGGLVQNDVRMEESGPALANQGNIFKRLFGTLLNAKQKSNVKTELVILLKPTIVESLESPVNFDEYLIEEE